MTDAAPRWWHETTVYQVYPRSFADSNGDGLGDLAGVVDHLDHLVDLGVGAVWLSPFFVSPQEDFGYDIADYCDVAPEYGDLAAADHLIEEAHRRGLRVVLDLVLNHTSDQHPWFRLSKASRSNPKSDWYLWRDGRGRGGRKPPNNWRSAMEIPTAWQWGAERQQWYLATFLPFQPDLNYRNPDVREAMFDVVRFWLDRGVDGFRLDIFGAVMKDPAYRDNPLRPHLGGIGTRIWDRRYTENTDDSFQLAKDLRAVVDEYRDPERILIGEVFGDPAVLRRYLGDDDGLHLVFLFDFLAFRYSAEYFRDRITTYEVEYPAPVQPTYVLENHDRSRLLDRVGGDESKARTLAVLLCTLRGVPFIYQGQELGLANTRLPLSTARDPIHRTFFSWLPEVVVNRLPDLLNRDAVRTPIPWTRGPNAGFTTPEAEPWLPLGPDAATRNVEAQTGQDASILELYRALLTLRRERPALHRGSLELVAADPAWPDVLAFRRVDEVDGAEGSSDRVVVVVNLGADRAEVAVAALVGPGSQDVSPQALVATADGVAVGERMVVLPAHSAVVVDLAPSASTAQWRDPAPQVRD